MVKNTRIPTARRGRADDGDAFFPDPGDGPALATDDLAEELAEEFLIGATSGEQPGEDWRNAEVPEESGGPFVLTSAAEEMAHDREPGKREPFPMSHSASADPLARFL